MELDRNKLDLALAEKCYNLRDLAKATGLGGSTISKIANGSLDLQPKTIGKIAKALDVSVVELLQEGKQFRC